jgi:aspartate ammonia-lyase
MNRIEKDSLGQKHIPSDALYGIHSVRARENFPGNSQFPIEWYKAVGTTKLACYNTYRKFSKAAKGKSGKDLTFNTINDSVLDALCAAAREVAAGTHFDNFIVPAIQGGAGTSINMNINEIISNSALLKCGHKCGD